MNLLVMRHAQAIDLGQNGVADDESRYLTPAGQRQAAEMASALRSRGVRIEGLITSPLVRARQTAEIVAQVYGLGHDSLLQTDHLAPGLSCRKLAKYLRQHASDHAILFGHEPDLGIFTSWLIGSKRAHVRFAKGGVALIETDDDLERGSGELRWLLTPEWGRMESADSPLR
jgi:phosphohistidine phosphatase